MLPGPRYGEGLPERGPRDYPVDNVPRPADRKLTRAASCASRRFAEFELALVALAECEPRGDELAAVLSISRERLERHYLRRYRPLIEEWDWSCAA